MTAPRPRPIVVGLTPRPTLAPTTLLDTLRRAEADPAAQQAAVEVARSAGPLLRTLGAGLVRLAQRLTRRPPPAVGTRPTPPLPIMATTDQLTAAVSDALAPVEQALARLEAAANAHLATEIPAPDLSPLVQRIDALAAKLNPEATAPAAPTVPSDGAAPADATATPAAGLYPGAPTA